MLTDDQRLWLCALSSPMVALNRKAGARYDIPSFWSHEITDEKDLLRSAWNIVDRDTLLATVFRMTDHGHAEQMGGGYHRWAHTSPSRRLAMREAMPEEGRLQALFLDKTYAVTGWGGIRAWDLGRMGFLLRNGLYLGYVTEQELNYLHIQLGLRARYWYASWEQYLNGFFCGRLLWMALSADTPDAVESLLFGSAPAWLSRMVGEVTSAPENPATYLPWQTPLSEMDRPEGLPEDGL